MKTKLLLILLTLLPMMASADSNGTYGDNLTWTYVEATNTLTISGNGRMSNYAEAPWYSFRSNIRTVVIQNGVTSIGYGAFRECSSLTSVTIPNSVTSIGEAAFSDCSSLTSVTIPNSVTSIGYGAFKGCSGLTSVTIPNSVTSIGVIAFNFCTGLTSVTIPNSVTSIGDYAFNGCSGLTSVKVESGNTKYDSRGNCNAIIESSTNTLICGCKNTTIPNSVTKIGNLAFNYCTGLTSVTIPNSVTSIGESAFYQCSGLTSVTIGNSVTSIGESAFYQCSGLTSVTIPNSVTSIGESAFYQCSGLTSVTIGNSVTSIGSSAFSSCSGLTSVTIGNSVTSIDQAAFSDCSSLTSVTIPNSVTSIGYGAFKGCSGLTSVTIPNSVTSIGNSAFYGTPFYNNMADGVIYLGKCLYQYKGTMSENTRIVIANGTISISPSAFYNCSGLTSVTIPNSVTSIGSYAFYGCSGLTSVTIPDGVTSIGQSTFYQCSGLTSVTIPNSVTSIGTQAFYGCSGLQEVVCLAKSFPTTSYSAFNNVCLSNVKLFVWSKLLERYRNNSPWSGFGTISAVDVQRDGFYYVFDTPKEEATITDADNTSGNLNIPSYVVYEGVDYDVVAVHEYAFLNCSDMTSVNIPNSVTTIGDGAFEGCSGLTSLSIGKKTKSIGQNAFKGCSGLNSITVASGNTVYDSRNDCNAIIETASGKLILGCNTTVIPDGVTSIEEYAFYNYSGLTSVTIPNSVTSIGSYAFNGCSGLTSVHISDLEAWCNISFGNQYSNPLYQTHHLNLNGTEVKDLAIPTSVNAIGNYAFYGCSGLTSVNIPESVTSIGDQAFYGCTGLSSVSINSDAIVSANRTENDNLNNIFGSQVKEYVVGDDVTAIGDYAFQGNTNLSTITLRNSVTAIGSSAFYNCSGLTSANIPDGVTSIGSSAFYNCRITSTTIPASLTAIGENAFYGCSRLNSTTISDLEAWCNISFGNQYSNPLYQTHHLNLNGTEVKDLAIPTSVNAIGNYAFYGCSGLTSVNIHEGVTSIGNQAFYGCSGMTSVTIPNSVTSIGDYAFQSCDGLKSVHISDLAAWCNLTFNTPYANPLCYANHLFLNGEEVKKLVIPNSVLFIGDRAFQGCTGLTSVEISNSVKAIGQYAFQNCNGVTSVTINSNAIVSADRTENDNLNNIFGSQVKEYIIGNRVTSIGENAFRGNTNLNTVSVGKYIGSIGDNAFYGCSNLATFTCYAADIPTANSSVFEGIDLTMATLYVPASALEDYEETKPWKRFGTILPIDEEAVPTAIETAAADDYKEYFDLSGRRVTSSQRGLLIVRDWSGKTRKVMVK